MLEKHPEATKLMIVIRDFSVKKYAKSYDSYIYLGSLLKNFYIAIYICINIMHLSE